MSTSREDNLIIMKNQLNLRTMLNAWGVMKAIKFHSIWCNRVCLRKTITRKLVRNCRRKHSRNMIRKTLPKQVDVFLRLSVVVLTQMKMMSLFWKMNTFNSQLYKTLHHTLIPMWKLWKMTILLSAMNVPINSYYLGIIIASNNSLMSILKINQKTKDFIIRFMAINLMFVLTLMRKMTYLMIGKTWNWMNNRWLNNLKHISIQVNNMILRLSTDVAKVKYHIISDSIMWLRNRCLFYYSIRLMVVRFLDLLIAIYTILNLGLQQMISSICIIHLIWRSPRIQ